MSLDFVTTSRGLTIPNRISVRHDHRSRRCKLKGIFANPRKRQIPMGRKASVDFRARRSLPQLLLRLRSKPNGEWPPPLSDAWQILNSDLKLPHVKALPVILESVSAAQQCLKAQNQQLRDLEQIEAATRIRRVCNRISKGINRASVALGRRLDLAILPLVQTPPIDLEVIESIFEAAATIFEEFPEGETFCTAIRALRDLPTAPFYSLDIALRSEAEKAISNFAVSSNVKPQIRATDVFATLAEALDGAKIKKPTTQSGISITHYVSAVAEIWRRAGLKPSRGVGFLNVDYMTRFHRFANLVLIAISDPGGPCNRGEISKRELVSDHHVRTALQP
jgi:hypothetical protein